MVFSLHEDHDSYEPPQWVEVVAQIHKNQKTTVKPKQTKSPEAAPSLERKKQKKVELKIGQLLLKWFCLIMAIGIIVTTLLGIYMSFKYNKNHRLLWALLSAGLALPAVLLFLQ
jgi:hypothetical protein